MNSEMNIKFNDDKSITINNVRYIPEFWGEAKASAKPEKRHTGIEEEPERGDSIYYIDGDGILEMYEYSSGDFEPEDLRDRYLRGRVTTDEQLAYDRDKATQIRFALEKYAAEHNAVQYIGIAADEPKRLARLEGTNKKSLLAEYGYTEQMVYDLCVEYDLLLPIYEHTNRGGCWFCPNSSLRQFMHLKIEYPELWGGNLKCYPKALILQ